MEGIHGWLDPEETLLLSYGLNEIKDPAQLTSRMKIRLNKYSGLKRL